MKITEQKIEDLAAELTELRNDFLCERGWEYTSSTPGALWLYRKKFKGAWIYADRGTAIEIQANLDGEIYHDWQPS